MRIICSLISRVRWLVDMCISISPRCLGESGRTIRFQLRVRFFGIVRNLHRAVPSRLWKSRPELSQLTPKRPLARNCGASSDSKTSLIEKSTTTGKGITLLIRTGSGTTSNLYSYSSLYALIEGPYSLSPLSHPPPPPPLT
jgi:hypothetical protein